MKKYIIIVCLFLVIILLVNFSPGINKDYVKTSKIYISEVMASNNYTISDEDGDYSDYIEIYNGYDYEVNLDGYYLSDDEYNPKKWMIAGVRIKPREYILIFASGKDKLNHTNFKLNSSAEESVLLTENDGNIISKITYSNMKTDISYGYVNGKYLYTSEATPGKENSKVGVKGDNKNYEVVINEYMSSNNKNNYNSEGYYYDWVELYNRSSSEVLLTNIYLTDNSNNLNKYKLPEVKIEGNGYLLVYLAGDKVNNDNEICADFKLSLGEELILSNGEKIIDRVKVVSLDNNISYGLKDDNWYYFTTPTPGGMNDTAYFSGLKVVE